MRAHKERKEIEKHQLCVSLHVARGTKGSKEKEQDRCDENHQKRRREMSERKNTAYKNNTTYPFYPQILHKLTKYLKQPDLLSVPKIFHILKH